MTGTKRKNYPAATGIYKVEVQRGGDWKQQSALRLGISVGNPSHEGEKLAALVEWAAARFDTVNVLVADSLQRHNLMAESAISEDEAMLQAQEAGADWIARNRAMLDKLPLARLYRFDDFRLHTDFMKMHRLLCGLYERNMRFRKLIDGDAQAFLERRKQREGADKIDDERFLKASRAYLIEELVVMKIFHEDCPGVEVYPGKFIQAITSPERHKIDGFPESLREYRMIEVDFIRNKACRRLS